MCHNIATWPAPFLWVPLEHKEYLPEEVQQTVH